MEDKDYAIEIQIPGLGKRVVTLEELKSKYQQREVHHSIKGTIHSCRS